MAEGIIGLGSIGMVGQVESGSVKLGDFVELFKVMGIEFGVLFLYCIVDIIDFDVYYFVFVFIVQQDFEVQFIMLFFVGGGEVLSVV